MPQHVEPDLSRALETAERTLEAALRLKATRSPLFTEEEIDDMIDTTQKTIASIQERTSASAE